jgi:hypothetical protein
MRSKRSNNRLHVSSHAKVRSTRIGNAWLAASARGHLALARILCEVRDEARMENALLIVCGIKAASEVEGGASQVGIELLQRLQVMRIFYKTRNL